MTKTRIQLALLIAAILYVAWGMGLLLAPGASQQLITRPGGDNVLARLFGASLLAWAACFFMGAREPTREIVRVSAIGMLVIGLISASLMLLFQTMRLNPSTILSLLINLGVCGFLLMHEIQRDLESRPQRRTPVKGPDRAVVKKKPAQRRPATRSKKVSSPSSRKEKRSPTKAKTGT